MSDCSMTLNIGFLTREFYALAAQGHFRLRDAEDIMLVRHSREASAWVVTCWFYVYKRTPHPDDVHVLSDLSAEHGLLPTHQI